MAEPFGLSLTFGYDAAGNRNSVTDNQGGVLASTFDLLNLLGTRTLDTAAADLRLDYAYTAQNRLDNIARSTDLAGAVAAGNTGFVHDDTGRVIGITHHAVGGGVLADYGYGYDDAGRLTSRTENSVTTTFGYDDAGQLTSDGATSHNDDGSGNRPDTGYVTGTGNRLQSDGTWTYTYDAAGQLVKKSQGASAETWTYSYDHRGQMVWAEDRATDGGSLLTRVEYAYDASSDRSGSRTSPAMTG